MMQQMNDQAMTFHCQYFLDFLCWLTPTVFPKLSSGVAWKGASSWGFSEILVWFPCVDGCFSAKPRKCAPVLKLLWCDADSITTWLWVNIQEPWSQSAGYHQSVTTTCWWLLSAAISSDRRQWKCWRDLSLWILELVNSNNMEHSCRH